MPVLNCQLPWKTWKIMMLSFSVTRFGGATCRWQSTHFLRVMIFRERQSFRSVPTKAVVFSSTDSSIAEICTGADVLDGLEIRGSVAQNSQDEALTAVTDWLDKIEFRRELRRYYHHGKIKLNTRMGQGVPEKRQGGSQKK